MKYAEAGNPLGTPVILLHGYTDTGRSFQFIMEALATENNELRIIAPDLRGHGESSMPDSARCSEAPETCFAPADFAADIIALMDQLNIPKAHIVGHSMGSVIAQELALHHAGRVNSLVLIGTFVNGKECPVCFFLSDLVEKTITDKDWKAIMLQKNFVDALINEVRNAKTQHNKLYPRKIIDDTPIYPIERYAGQRGPMDMPRRISKNAREYGKQFRSI